MPPVHPTIQAVVDQYAAGLESPRLLFDLYPSPRPTGKPKAPYRPLPAAIVLSSIAGFETFAENLVATVLYNWGLSFAQIAKTADLTNPSVKDLDALMGNMLGAGYVTPANAGPKWQLAYIGQSKKPGTSLGINPQTYSWTELLDASESWIQVRHNLTHGLVTGLKQETWHDPKATRVQHLRGNGPKRAAREVLSRVKSSTTLRGLYFWNAVECCLVHSHGAAEIAQATATVMSETVNVKPLLKFDAI